MKAEILKNLNTPFVIIASTDRKNINSVLPRYVEELKCCTGMRILTHFQAEPGLGYPVAQEANAILLTSVLNSSDPYLRSHEKHRRAVIESNLPDERDLTRISCAGLVLGKDSKSASHLKTLPVDISEKSWFDVYHDIILRMAPDVLYLYRRDAPIEPAIVRHVRERIGNDIVLFVSGCVKTRQAALTLLRSGANFVPVGTALEGTDWKEQLLSIVQGPLR